MLVAAAVGVPIFFLLLTTIGPANQGFSNMYGMLNQVASYQLIGEEVLFCCSHHRMQGKGHGFVGCTCSIFHTDCCLSRTLRVDSMLNYSLPEHRMFTVVKVLYVHLWMEKCGTVRLLQFTLEAWGSCSSTRPWRAPCWNASRAPFAYSLPLHHLLLHLLLHGMLHAPCKFLVA